MNVARVVEGQKAGGAVAVIKRSSGFTAQQQQQQQPGNSQYCPEVPHPMATLSCSPLKGVLIRGNQLSSEKGMVVFSLLSGHQAQERTSCPHSSPAMSVSHSAREEAQENNSWR
ncbi:hypothetical protein E2C01_076685 [Portunus trituberculatus]|uniref:Uncharacterized protein n=1 Tax=Portunus trituberculatus TaxID=210409 RepID=A0A5B7IDU5_PORTR|nr:hypothetical protein [Portunus trituberculatus]